MSSPTNSAMFTKPMTLLWKATAVVHLAQLDVAHDVVEGLEEPLGRALPLDETTRAGDIPGTCGPAYRTPSTTSWTSVCLVSP